MTLACSQQSKGKIRVICDREFKRTRPEKRSSSPPEVSEQLPGTSPVAAASENNIRLTVYTLNAAQARSTCSSLLHTVKRTHVDDSSGLA